MPIGTKPPADTDFTPQEAQDRFERALRAGLNMPPVKRPAKRKEIGLAASAYRWTREVREVNGRWVTIGWWDNDSVEGPPPPFGPSSGK